MLIKEKSYDGVFIALACVLGAILYIPLMQSYFLTDDFNNLRFLNICQSDFIYFLRNFGLNYFYRPVFAFVLWIEFHLFKHNASLYYLVNIIVHLINTTLVYFLVNTITQGRSKFIGFWAGLLFLIHPVHSNVVCWIASGPILWSNLFLLASFLTYLYSRKSGKWIYFILLFCFFGLALFSYESAVILPFLIIAYEWLLSPQGSDSTSALFKKYRKIVYLGIILFLGLYLLVRMAEIGKIVGGYQDWEERVSHITLFTIFSDIATSFRKIFNPAFDEGIISKLRLFCYVFLMPFIGLSILRLVTTGRQKRRVVFWILWALLSLAPFAFLPILPYHSRYAYLSSVGICALIAIASAGVCDLVKSRVLQIFGLLLVTLYAAFYFVLSMYYVDIYQKTGKWVHFMQRRISKLYMSQEKEKTMFVITPDYPRVTYYYPDLRYVHENISGTVFGPPFFEKQLDIYYFPGLKSEELELLMNGARGIIFVRVGRDYQLFIYPDNEKDQQGYKQPLESAIDIVYPLDGDMMDGDFWSVILRPRVKYSQLKLFFLNICYSSGIRVKYTPGMVSVDLKKKGFDNLKFYRNNKVFWGCFALDEQGRVIGYSGLKSFWVNPPKAK